MERHIGRNTVLWRCASFQGKEQYFSGCIFQSAYLSGGDLSSLLYWKKLRACISWGNTITNRPGTVGDCSQFLSSEAALFCKRELSSQGEHVRRHGRGIRALSWDVSVPALLNMKTS